MNDELLYKFLTHSCDEGELRQIDEWISADPSHAEWLFGMEDIWSLKDVLTYSDKARIRKAFWQFSSAARPRNTRRYLRTFSAVAACLAILVLFLRFHQSDTGSPQPGAENGAPSYAELQETVQQTKDIQLVLSDDSKLVLESDETDILYDSSRVVVDNQVVALEKEETKLNQFLVPPGKRGVLHLSDGSTIHVNAGTRVIYPTAFNDQTREIYVNGEIYIEVQPDAEHPFVVKTRDLDVTVLGTRFNVTAYEEDSGMMVTLVSGSVKVENKTRHSITQLKPDEMYVDDDSVEQVLTVDASKVISWVDGIYNCKNEELGSIIQRLNKYYGTDLGCDPGIGRVRFSGKLNLKDDLSDVLDAISFSLPIERTEKDGKVVLASKD